MRITAEQLDLDCIATAIVSAKLPSYMIDAVEFDIYKANPNGSQNGILRISDGALFRISIPVYRAALTHQFMPDSTYYTIEPQYPDLLKYHTGLVQQGEVYNKLQAGATGTIRRVQYGFIEVHTRIITYTQIITMILLKNHPIVADGTSGTDTSDFTSV